MTFQQIAAIGGLSALLALTGVACSDGSKTPTAPTAAVAGDGNGTATVAANAGDNDAANADGSTLKVSAPGGLAPASRLRVDSLKPTLSWTPSTARFAPAATLGYQIEIYEVNTLIATVEASALTYAVASDLKYDTVYRWRVRAKVGTDVGPWATTVDFQTPLPPPPPPPTFGGGGGGAAFGPQRNIGIGEAISLIIGYHNAIRADLGSRSTREQRVEFLYAAVGIVAYGHPQYNPQGGDPDWCVKDAGGGRPPSDDVIVRCGSREAWDLISSAGANGYSWHQDYIGRLPNNQNVYSPPISSLPGGGGPALPPVTGPASPVNGRTPDPPAGQRLPLPDVQGLIAQWTAERPDLFPSQQCPRGIKYVTSPWQDYIMDRLRQVDTRWGYNAKPTRTAADNGGVPVVAAGDEILYHYSGGPDQGSTEVYAVDILEQHCGNPRLTWRVFTGEERVIWTGAGRF